MKTLYQKYRSQTFGELYGQEHIKLTLSNEVEEENIAHAYLFCGPRAVGKTSVARILAKAINCENRKKGESEPCNKCKACLSITKGNSMDVVEIDAASHTGVDNVRENIIEASRVSPASLKYKMFIIDEVHMLSTSAFNALLKVMEEPPKNVLFVLCTTEIHKIPLTIISRCQRFDFKRIGIPQIVKKLFFICENEKIEIDKKVLEEIARRSEGHMRDAESLLGQVIAIGSNDKKISQEDASLIIPRSDLAEVIKLIDLLIAKNTGIAIEFVNKMIDEGVDIKIFVNELIEMLRRLMLLKINPAFIEKLSLEIGEDLEQKLNNIGITVDLQRIINILDRFMIAKNELKNSFIIQLPIEIAIVELCSSVKKNIVDISMNSLEIDDNKTEIVQEDLKNAEKKADNKLNISQEKIKEKWFEVENIIKKDNNSLASILGFCQPQGVINGELKIIFKYKIHQDRFDNIEIRKILEKALQIVYKESIIVKTELDINMEMLKKTTNQNSNKKDIQKNNSSNDDEMVDNLLKTFGGRVVN